MPTLIAWVGLASLLLIAVLAESALANGLANLAAAAFGLAVAIAGIQASRWPRQESTVRSRFSARPTNWAPYVIAVVLLTGFASQTWFRQGMAIAGGDVPPPNGTGWLTRLFVSWAWSGSDLGSTSTLEQIVPWGAVIWGVHLAGGSADLAQRVWFSACFISAGVACLMLLRALDLGPAGALFGAFAYSFSPFAVANVVPNPVMLLAFALLPALPTVVLLGARARVTIPVAAVLLAASAPLLGFIYVNPPTLGIVLVAILATPIIAGWLYGRSAARRGVLVLTLGVPLAALLSAYWIVPSMLQLHNAALSQLSSLSSWTWTESRATLRNGFWLNTLWAWAYRDYYPYAGSYDNLPLSVFRFAPAVLAFGALTIGAQRSPDPDPRAGLRLTAVAAGIAIALIFLGTGTNPPGNIVFDRIYSLPMGWLLREPGRFLLVADLMFAILIGRTAQRLLQFDWRQMRPTAFRRLSIGLLGVAPLGVVVLLPGLPLLNGQVVSDSRPTLPPMHVRVPDYWTEMSDFIDQAPIQGGVLVMPPDDYYQMPYRWGYYGSDSFIGQLTSRSILVPTQSTYFSTSAQLSAVEGLVVNSILAHDWKLEEHLLLALGTPLVLVRGDIDLSYPGRTIVAPSAIASALRQSANMDLINVSGPLLLFRLRGESSAMLAVAPYVATVNTPTPDLRVLSRLPERAALISLPPRKGVPSITELPPVEEWQVSQSEVTRDFVDDPGWTYSVIQLDSQRAPMPVADPAGPLRTTDPIRVTRIPGPARMSRIRVAESGTTALVNGDFHKGLWGPVGDCNPVGGVSARASLDARILTKGGPDGGEFLRLSAGRDIACEVEALTWRGGPLVFTMSLRNESGSAPRICIWETGPQRCVAIPPVVTGDNQWEPYRAVVMPDPGTTALSLFLYADGSGTNITTNADYANANALELPSLPQIDVLGTPLDATDSTALEVHQSTFSSDWHGPAGAEHVVVDGIINGWLIGSGQQLVAVYQPDSEVRAGFIVSSGGLALIVAIIGLSMWRRRQFLVATLRRLITR